MACFQIIHVEMRSNNCPNLNRKSVIRASKVLKKAQNHDQGFITSINGSGFLLSIRWSSFPSGDHLFNQDSIFSIWRSYFQSGFHIFCQDFITLMLVLGLGQLLTAMVKPVLALTGNFHLMQVSGQESEIWLFAFLPQISSVSSVLQHCWSCILVSPRLLCQPHLLLSQPFCRQNSSSPMGLTKFLQLQFEKD